MEYNWVESSACRATRGPRRADLHRTAPVTLDRVFPLVTRLARIAFRPHEAARNGYDF